MEPMQINVLSVVEQNGRFKARARAVAHDATIWLEVRFEAAGMASQADLKQQARDEIIRYLDPA